MFGKRPDGRRLRKVDPTQLITGFLMKKRYDSMTMYEDTVYCEAWDVYIKEKAQQGIKLCFDGTESILEVAEKVNEAIE